MHDLDFNFWNILLSIISLTISLVTAFNVFWKQRRNISFKIEEISFTDFIDNDRGFLSIQMFFINHSQNPISINYIELYDKHGNKYTCRLIPSFVEHRFNKMIDTNSFYERFIESAHFPIRLDSLDAKMEYVYFDLPQNFEIVNCIIYTNRGNPIPFQEIILPIKDCDHYRDGNRYNK
ncbi:conserved domain protein [Amedibacillus dolichus CAG:375]|uniref:Conserved domain protein n=1 Tax=Amedibacillus dolichus CAG:375 TaxID=1263076 RepID=R7GAM5_9FIRM|nr:conserved domain protein [Amedibacillus dolichus CAG:375]